MLGLDLAAEMSNPDCPWGADFSEETLRANRQDNDRQVDRAIALANRYPDIVFSVAVGNEATVEWTDHLVPVDRLIAHVRKIKRAVDQPVTSCDNYVPWTRQAGAARARARLHLGAHLSRVGVPKTMLDALDYTKENYHSVADRYPGKPVVITEAGWTTASNGRGIEPANASEEIQAQYYEALLEWTNDEEILTFVFEAFDEPWKGSSRSAGARETLGSVQTRSHTQVGDARDLRRPAALTDPADLEAVPKREKRLAPGPG